MTGDDLFHIKILQVHRIPFGDHQADEYLIIEWGPSLRRGTSVTVYSHQDHEEDTHIYLGREEIVPPIPPDFRHRYMAALLAIGTGKVPFEWTADQIESEWYDLYGED